MCQHSQQAACQDAESAPAPFRIRVADLVVEIHPLHQAIRRMCDDYVIGDMSDGAAPDELSRDGEELSASEGAASKSQVASKVEAGGALSGLGCGLPDRSADLVIRVTQADIEAERAIATAEHPWSDAYLETLAVLRAISNELPQRRRLLVHGAVIQYAGKAYLFTAPSGTGKSTHIMLWRQYLGADVRVVNGDKPFLRIPELPDQPPIAYGTPWAGKENWQENASAPLAGIVLLSRSEPGASTIRKVNPAACLDRVLRQIYLPKDALAAANTLELLDAVLARVPLYELACDMSEHAVHTSFEALTGRLYRPAI